MDTELDAMKEVTAALEPLDAAARMRVLSWAAARYGVSGRAPQPKSETAPSGLRTSVSTFGEFAELFHAAGAPSASRERALLAAFWTTVAESQESFGSQQLNNLLKHLGYSVGNITDALSQCMREKPAWIIQVRKSGSSKQARKIYRLTDAGSRQVNRMIDNGGEE